MSLDVAAPDAIRPAIIGVPFARELGRHGDRLALVSPDGTTVAYSDLARRVAATARQLGPVRRLVLVAAAGDVEPVVTYLAALSAGHPVLLTAADDPERLAALVDTYDPDVVGAPDSGTWRLRERRPGTAHRLHRELALLLSTSGSTGSPKLVRLSAGNVQANAAAIAGYLGIRDTDRALASLPLHYCYGLSVLNSNLLRGAALLLTGDSVVDDSFWDHARRWRATSLHGVPYTFELLDAAGFANRELPSLRYVTQAGGRLDPGRVRALAELGERSGWRLFVMYGQTEATARMAYLPPELARTHPGCVGVPVPGGSFELRGGGDTGELVYRGPNVMLGYAERPDDLALGRTVDALATGDLARRTPEGLYEIIGRTSRFVKICGLRIDLDQAERLLSGAGHTAACTGDDEGLVVAVTGDPDAARRLLRERLALPPHRVHVHELAELPRLANGKIDYRALDRGPTANVRDAFTTVLGHSRVDGDATFVALGGDSLSYVRMSMELGRLLGTVPSGWPTMTVRELERLRPRRRPVLRPVETGVVLRALGIVLVVGTHVGLFHVLGGAHLLLVLAGWSVARFGLAGDPAGTSRRLLRGAARIAIPAVVWLVFRALTTHDVALTNALLVSNYAPGPVARGYWFIEVLVQTLLVLALLFAIPAVRRFERGHPFGLALIVLAAALVLNLTLDGLGQPFDHAMSAHGALWFLVLGWVAQRATTAGGKALTAALALALLPGYFGDEVREVIVAGGLLLLLTVHDVPVPAPLARLLAVLAGASLAVYLTHYAIYPELLPYLPAAAVVAACLAAGAVVWLLAGRVVRAGRKLLPKQEDPWLSDTAP